VIKAIEDSNLLAVKKSSTQKLNKEDMDLEKIQTLISQLREFLEDDDSEATDVMDVLQPMIEGNGLSIYLDKVYKAVSNYDFDDALEELKNFETKWQNFKV